MSRVSQREIVLNALRSGPKTMWELTTDLRILRPGARIFELRKKHRIDSDYTEVQGRRVAVYTYRGVRGEENRPVSERERTSTVIACAECGQGVVRKRKARPLRPGEKPFCSDSHRAAYRNRQKAIKEIEEQQSLNFGTERLRSEREREDNFSTISTKTSTSLVQKVGACL